MDCEGCDFISVIVGEHLGFLGVAGEARELHSDGACGVDDAVAGLGVEEVLAGFAGVEAVDPVEVEGGGGGGVRDLFGEGGGFREGHRVLPGFLRDEVLSEALWGWGRGGLEVGRGFFEGGRGGVRTFSSVTSQSLAPLSSSIVALSATLRASGFPSRATSACIDTSC